MSGSPTRFNTFLERILADASEDHGGTISTGGRTTTNPCFADEVDRSVVLALLQVAFLGKCDDQGLGPQGWLFSCLPDLVADCRESGDYVVSAFLGHFCWDVVIST